MTDAILSTLSQDAPPEGLDPPAQALWWLARGEWRTGSDWAHAHAICQTAEGDRDHDLVHALVHLIEGDGPNAAYWYRRAGQSQASDDPEQEWHRVAATVMGGRADR